MIQGFYTAKATFKERQKNMDIIANNMANINTDGYKKSSGSFEEALYSVTQMEYPDENKGDYQIGCGSIMVEALKDFSQGDLVETEGNLDFALVGEGFLGVKDEEDNLLFTRGGTFSFEPADQGFKYIKSSTGHYLVDDKLEKIKIPEGISEIKIDSNGNLGYDGQEKGVKLNLANFNNLAGLDYLGLGIYKQSFSSGNPVKADGLYVKQGFKERSNVDLASEMTEMITNQRIFEFNSRVIQTIDEMQGMANNLRK